MVSIDWFSKIYLLLEISHLHRSSYKIDDLVIIVIQSACLTLLLISYVFLPNLSVNYDNDDQLNSIGNASSSKSFDKSSNDNEFSIHKRSLFSQIMFFYFEQYVFFGYRNNYNVTNIMPLEKNLKVNYVLNDYQKNYRDKYLKDTKFEDYNILHLSLVLYKSFFIFNTFLFIITILLGQFDPQIIKLLITFVRLGKETVWHGYVYMVLLLSNTLIRVTVYGEFLK